MTETVVCSPPPPPLGWQRVVSGGSVVPSPSVRSNDKEFCASDLVGHQANNSKPNNFKPNNFKQGLVRLDTFSLALAKQGDFAFSSVAFTALSPCRALTVFAGEAKGTSVSAKIACKFATSHCSEKIRSVNTSVIKSLPREQWSTVLLESALSSGNDALYGLGSRLAATGRVRTCFAGFVVAGPSVAVARLGGGGLYLARHGRLFPFFFGDDSGPKLGESGDIELHLVSSRLERGDTIFIFSRSLAQSEEHSLLDILERRDEDLNYDKNLTSNGPYSESVITSFSEWCETTICHNQPVGFAARLTLG